MNRWRKVNTLDSLHLRTEKKRKQKNQKKTDSDKWKGK